MSDNIEIVIKGGSFSGKSTLLYMIERRLRRIGLDVTISEESQTAKEGGILYLSLEETQERLHRMIEKGTKIILTDEQLPRKGSEQ